MEGQHKSSITDLHLLAFLLLLMLMVGSFSHLLADPRLGYCKMLYRKVNLKENQVDWPLAWREKTEKFPPEDGLVALLKRGKINYTTFLQ